MHPNDITKTAADRSDHTRNCTNEDCRVTEFLASWERRTPADIQCPACRWVGTPSEGN